MDQSEWFKGASSLFSEIRREWDTAEKQMKVAEHIGGEVVMPSVNELRYAGRRLVDALNVAPADPERARGYLDEAKFNCHRARHDAIDAGTAKITADVSNIVGYLGYEVAVGCYPNLPSLRAALTKAHALIAESRLDRETREKIYATVAEIDFPAIVAMHGDMMANEDQMRAVARSHRVDRLRNSIFGWVGIIGFVVGVSIAIVAWRYPHLLGAK